MKKPYEEPRLERISFTTEDITIQLPEDEWDEGTSGNSLYYAERDVI